MVGPTVGKMQPERAYLEGRRRLLREILRMGRRSCTLHYDDGRFVVDDLLKWDEFCKEELGDEYEY